MHSHLKTERLGSSGIARPLNGRPTALLQPVIDLLQYQGFCERIKAEVNKMVRALDVTGLPCSLRITSVGENGRELVSLLNEDSTWTIGGEAILRIDDRYSVIIRYLYPTLKDELTQTYPSSDIPVPIFSNRTPPSSHAHTFIHPSTRPVIMR